MLCLHTNIDMCMQDGCLYEYERGCMAEYLLMNEDVRMNVNACVWTWMCVTWMCV